MNNWLEFISRTCFRSVYLISGYGLLAVVLLVFRPLESSAASQFEPPYAWSELDIEFLVDSYYTPLPGCQSGRAPACLGDNWPTTSTKNGFFTVWGDGVGPSGVGRKGQDVSLGVARLRRDGTFPENSEIYLGAVKDQRCKAELLVDGRVCGKSYGIIALDDRLLMWVSPGSGRYNYTGAELFSSDDEGLSWHSTAARFEADELILPTFVQFPKDYGGTLEGYLYIFGIRPTQVSGNLAIQKPGQVVAFRVKEKHAHDRSRYESLGTVFNDSRGGVGWTISVSYDQTIKKFVLMTEHDETMQGKLGIFVADAVDGPWRTVAYYQSWASEIGLAPVGLRTFHWNVLGYSEKDNFRVVFSGISNDDTYQSIKARWRNREP